MTAIDLLIEARWIIPIEPAGMVLENHAAAIDNGKIVAVLQQQEARLRFLPRQTKHLSHHVLIPGLVNLHTHAAMTLLRGIADDLPLMEWLQKHTWPTEQKFVSPQFVYDGTLLACAEMLQSGITCFNDMYFFPEAAAKAALDSGMRAAIGLITLDFPTAYGTDADDYLAKGLAIRDVFREEPLISFCLAPHAPYTVNDRNFSRVLAIAEQCNLPIHLHIHETQQEIDESMMKYGVRPIERLRRLGLLGPGLIGVHAVHLTPDEICLLAEHGCSIAHCPSSNLKLASGLPALISNAAKQGINIGLGTDSAASNNRLDILQEMRLAALLAKACSGQASTFSAHEVLRMATLGGAQALGLDWLIGSISPGKSADLCAIELDSISQLPCYDPASHVVYSAGRENVSDVWVSGKCRINSRKPVENTEIKLKKLASLWQNQIRPRQA
ncbi:TRZ/ATZ family hydrolase [Propionivibrio limicola]|uniref:TRZ/ATZ family hydrolase n=1 Tax=Propionivibrio limicola TaxID=167645 RepID=UPI0012909E7D|nr:TRZ/ATZ family hydrolase [Propionivibrio limicola]